MKELSIKEKAKAYDEALEKAVKIHRNYKGRVRAVDVVIEEVFPELQESEDEKIRGAIIHFISHTPTVPKGIIGKETMTAWLEKQGVQKLAEWHREDEQNLNTCLGYIQDEFLRRWLMDVIHAKYDKSVDKVEPKFKVGDWVIDKQGIVHQIANVIENVTNHTYSYDIVGGGYFNDNTEGVRLWTIQDAKPGDVLVNATIVLIVDHLGTFENRPIIYSWYFADSDKFYGMGPSECDRWEVKGFHPATKEQRDLLFQKMKEAGYEWDAEHKQLRKIENEIEIPFGAKDSELQEATYYIPKGFHAKIEGNNIIIKKGEQKSTWSKEDDKILKSIIINIENLQFSEDMQEKYRHIPNANKSYYQIKIDWLKSLRTKNTWKPSEEQINTLQDAIVYVEGYNSNFKGSGSVLEKLYKDLKKLKE